LKETGVPCNAWLCASWRFFNGDPRSRCINLVAGMESVPEPTGTRAYTVVTRSGCDVIESVRSTSFNRSCMRLKPSPPAFLRVRVKAVAVMADRQMNLVWRSHRRPPKCRSPLCSNQTMLLLTRAYAAETGTSRVLTAGIRLLFPRVARLEASRANFTAIASRTIWASGRPSPRFQVRTVL
jgi:hypothetical protein